ncbi:hypothetical protein [Stappia sp.]|uniref:hypothetical protein n=1 Tax=Stappia sp. TaxID=1870903 RepID=UPI0032D993F9
MTHPGLNDDETDREPPLDPAAERLQAKLKRLLAVSGLIMTLGFMAVFAAIIYRLSEGGSAPDAGDIAATIAIGKDARVESMAQAEGMLILLVREGAASKLLYLDPATGRVLGETAFVAR